MAKDDYKGAPYTSKRSFEKVKIPLEPTVERLSQKSDIEVPYQNATIQGTKNATKINSPQESADYWNKLK